jgi:uncharacterized membrane protein
MFEGSSKAMNCRKLALISILILLSPTISLVEGQIYYTPLELSFKIDPDGYVTVDLYAEVDPTMPRVNVLLFGSQYLDIFVWDQDGLPLDKSPIEGGLVIDTLGAIYILVSYVTTDLTSKEGQIWTFSVSGPIPTSISLPKGATYIPGNILPLTIMETDGSIVLTMPEGDLEVSYTWVIGTKEHASAVIKDAEETIETIKAEGVKTTEADSLLQQARDNFDNMLYAEAEQLAKDAKESALGSQEAASSAYEAIGDAKDDINAAEQAGRTVSLEQARNLLQEAEDAYAAGEYPEAQTIAEEAQSAAAESEVPSTARGLSLWLLASVGAVVIGAVVFFMWRRKPRPAAVVRADAQSFDLEAIFEENPSMRLDDKEVVKYLASIGGEGFATEIRDRFEIPRTSLWRMVRRLEREGVVEVTSIGGQSLVRINPEYKKEGDGG